MQEKLLEANTDERPHSLQLPQLYHPQFDGARGAHHRGRIVSPRTDPQRLFVSTNVAGDAGGDRHY